MKRLLLILLPAAVSAQPVVHVHTGTPDGQPVILAGRDATLQLVVTAQDAESREHDATRAVRWNVQPAQVLQVSPRGLLEPLADGTAVVTAEVADGVAASVTVTVTGAGAWRRASFTHEVVPVLTKYGCNGGGCHGKTEGQNGFRLSLLGFEPADDYEYLVHEARGRRLFPAAPENSLLLMKGSGEMPHGGGARLERGTPDYQTLVRWMEQGMPPGSPDEARPVAISVFPAERLLEPAASQQLQVNAVYSDGTWRDITGLATFESGAPEMAEVDAAGLVTTASVTGDVAVMVRYQEHVGVFRATIPLGAPATEFPPETNFIDAHVFAKLRTLGLPPSAVCDDATFIRRVTIDVAGRLPTAEEVEQFVDDQSLAKREAAVDRLLSSTDYAEYFAGKWASLLRNRRDGAPAPVTYAFHAWVRDHLNRNTRFDEVVSRLISASGSASTNPPAAWYRAVTQPQEQMQDIAQVFAGQRLQCAQCHHHPYEKWSQEDYYGLMAFFSTLGRKPADEPGEQAVFHQWQEAKAENPKTRKPVKPTPLGGEPLALAPHDDPRPALAAWLTAPENPFFARTLANRYWKHFFQRALVEPEDDLRVTNPATNPALLDAMADFFVASGYDLKALVRTLCTSTTYQLSSDPNAHNAADRQNYSRFFPRRLPAEVLLDAVDTVTAIPTHFPSRPAGSRAVALPDDAFNASSYFLTVFGRPGNASACECERTQDSSLAQSLHLLNSKGVQEKLTHAQGRAAALTTDPAPVEDRVRRLFLTAFGRAATPDETRQAVEYIASKQGGAAAWEDMIWTLINAKEFLFNH